MLHLTFSSHTVLREKAIACHLMAQSSRSSSILILLVRNNQIMSYPLAIFCQTKTQCLNISYRRTLHEKRNKSLHRKTNKCILASLLNSVPDCTKHLSCLVPFNLQQEQKPLFLSTPYLSGDWEGQKNPVNNQADIPFSFPVTRMTFHFSFTPWQLGPNSQNHGSFIYLKLWERGVVLFYFGETNGLYQLPPALDFMQFYYNKLWSKGWKSSIRRILNSLKSKL